VWLIAIILLALLIVRVRPTNDVIFRLSAVIVWSITIMMPWSLEVMKSPIRFFTQFGVAADEIAPAWQILFGADRANAATPWFWGIGFAAVAVIVLIEERTHRLSRFAWVLIAASLAVAAVAQTIATFFGGPTSLPALSIPLLIINAGLVLSLASSVSTVRTRLRRSNFGWRQVSTALAVIFISLSPIAGFVTTLEIGSTATGMHREAEVTSTLLRGFTEESHLRTLLLSTSTSGAINASILDGRAEYFGDAAVMSSDMRQKVGSDIAQWLTSVNPDEISPLRKYAIGYISVPSGDQVARKVSTMGNLTRLINSRSSNLLNVWRVNEVQSRAYLNDGMTEDSLFLDVERDGDAVRVQGVVNVTDEKSVIHLAERATGDWAASVNGVKLEQTDNGLLTWSVPKNTSGDLLIEHDSGSRFGWLMLAGFAYLSIAVVLAPRRRNSYRDEWLEQA
jgi:hypothetical protein